MKVINVLKHLSLGSILLVFLMTLATSESYARETVKVDSLYFSIISDSLTAELVAPWEYDGMIRGDSSYYAFANLVVPGHFIYKGKEYTVTAIGGGCFGGDVLFKNKTLVSVTLPNTIKELQGGSFSDCAALKAIEIPSSVNTIGFGCFDGCTSLSEVEIPSSVISISGDCFNGCTSLVSVRLPDSWTELPQGMFYGCTSLKSITIPSSVKTIDGWCFKGCSSLRTVNFPSGVDSLGEECFAQCTAFTSFSLPSSVMSMGKSCFEACSNLLTIDLPENLKSLPEKCFDECEKLLRIVIPSSVSSVGKYCFNGCTRLASVSFNSPSSLTKLSDGCFKDCRGLSAMNLPEGLTELGEYCFYGCEGLKSISIPSSLEKLGSWCFYGCETLESIDLPNTVTVLSAECFAHCEALTSFHIPDYVTEIGGSAFNVCKKLKDITIPSTVRTIAGGAFAGTGIKAIVVPSSVTSIGSHAFWGCDSLQSATILGPVETLPEGVFRSDGNLASVTLPETIKSFGDDCFRECSSLLGIDFPPHIERMGDRCFYGCQGLKSITIPSSVDSLGASCFAATGIVSLKFAPNSSLQTIPYDCFSISTDSISLPENVTMIDSHCVPSSLAYLELPSTLVLLDNTFMTTTVGSPSRLVCHAVVPPTTVKNSFWEDKLSTAVLMVPEGSLDTYKSTSPWSLFGTIVPIGTVLKCPEPSIEIYEDSVWHETKVRINVPDSCNVSYTLDGSSPLKYAYHYDGDFALKENCTVKAAAYKRGWEYSDIVEKSVVATQYIGWMWDINNYVRPINVGDRVRVVAYNQSGLPITYNIVEGKELVNWIIYKDRYNSHLNENVDEFYFNALKSGKLTLEASSPADSTHSAVSSTYTFTIYDTSSGISAAAISSDSSDFNETEIWYSVSGMRLSKRPTQAGVYIHDGKKVIVK